LALVPQRALLREAEETPQVATLVLLVLRRQAHQLSHVRHPAPPSVSREEREVVVESGDRAVDQRVERQKRGLVAEAGEYRPEPPQSLHVFGGHPLRPLARLDRRPDVHCITLVAARRLAEQPQRIRAGTARRGGERTEQELVVERVRDGPEQAERVLHLL